MVGIETGLFDSILDHRRTRNLCRRIDGGGLKGEKGFLGARSPLGAYFVLTDKSDRDVPIAKQKEPGIGEVVSAVIDPAALANPMITRGGAP